MEEPWFDIESKKNWNNPNFKGDFLLNLRIKTVKKNTLMIFNDILYIEKTNKKK
jgi:hypothetical protein